MEARLQTLIDKIKNDGIHEAEKLSKTIVADAEEKAARILADAKKEAERIVEGARDDAARTEDAGKKALEQAGRNLVLGIEKNLTELCGRLLRSEIKNALTPEVVARILEKIIAKWDPERGVVVELSKEDEQTLTRGLVGRLRESARGGLSLKPVETIDAGFCVSEKDGNVYHDFTERAIAENLAQYLNPVLGDILKEGVK